MHRDMKPENVFLSGGAETVKVLVGRYKKWHDEYRKIGDEAFELTKPFGAR